MHDVIVIGGRCAGAPLARLLAKQNRSVLLIERDAELGDTLSTHFLWPRAASYLNRWGLLDEILAETPSNREIEFILEGQRFLAETPVEKIAARLERAHGDGFGATSLYACVRRRVLDRVLFEAAKAAGVEVLHAGVDGLLFEGTRVVGVRGRLPDGTEVTRRARIVVGADGRSSIVARELALARRSVQAECSFAYWTYFAGVPLAVPTLQKRGRFACAMVPTNFGAAMTLVWGPKERFPRFKTDIEGNYHKVLGFVSPELAARVKRYGRQVERFWGTAEQTAYQRDSAGEGWLLAGDAACFKDQCGAIGITHAFRDAEMAAEAIGRSLQEANFAPLMDYQRRREADVDDNFNFVCHQARMLPLGETEIAMFRELARDRRKADAFMAMYGDSLDSSSFAAEIGETPAGGDFPVVDDGAHVLADEALALSHQATEFLKVEGPDLLGRTEPFYKWWQARSETGTWQYGRTLKSFPGPEATLFDEKARAVSGINFASQDYLALGAHPRVREAAVRAIRDFGPHSAGSAVVIGNTELSRRLEAELSEHLESEHVVLFPTGWMAGFGTITGLVRESDHVVMDRLSHACLQQGIRAATRNVVRHEHLDVEAARAALKKIRAQDTTNAILVVSEGLFSMDSDSPDLEKLQAVCHEYGAVLFVDVAHDLGATGPRGTGQLGMQKLLGKVDLVMGAFSKTFASNGGFLATRNPAVREYLRMYGFPHVFSNALSPVQAAVVSTALEIVRSEEGDERRQKLFSVVHALRDEFARHGIRCGGFASPIVPVPIGDERVARVAHRLLKQRQVSAMIIEYPLVAVGFSRFRLQAMASHTPEQARTFAKIVVETLAEAREYVARHESASLVPSAIAATAHA